MRRLLVVLTYAFGALWFLSGRMLGAQYSSPWLFGVMAGALLAMGCYAVVSHAVGRAPYQGGDPSAARWAARSGRGSIATRTGSAWASRSWR